MSELSTKSSIVKNALLTLFTIFLSVSTICSQSVPAYVPSNGLLIYYPFNGNSLDASGSGIHGIVEGAQLSTDKNGNPLSAFDFDGVDDYITVPPSSLLGAMGDFTISLWFKFDQWEIQPGIVIDVIDKQYIFCGHTYSNVVTSNFIVQGFSIHPYLKPDSTEFIANATVNPNGTTYSNLIDTCPNFQGVWHHIVFLREGTTTYHYIDGILMETNYNDGAILNMNHNNYLGTAQGNNPNYSSFNFNYDGKIDEVGIWNRALSQNEVNNLFNEVYCPETAYLDTITFHVSSPEFINYSPTVYYGSSDSLTTVSGSCDSIINHFHEFIFDPGITIDTVQIFDSIYVTVTDTIFEMLYDTTFVIDSTFINVFDTITYYDSIFVTINDTVVYYDSISVTDTLFIDVELIGINPPNNINTIKVYPNPFNEFVIINTGDYSLMQNYSIEIITITGQTIFTTLIDQQEYQIDANDFGELGTFIIRILNNQGQVVETRKLILI